MLLLVRVVYKGVCRWLRWYLRNSLLYSVFLDITFWQNLIPIIGTNEIYYILIVDNHSRLTLNCLNFHELFPQTYKWTKLSFWLVYTHNRNSVIHSFGCTSLLISQLLPPNGLLITQHSNCGGGVQSLDTVFFRIPTHHLNRGKWKSVKHIRMYPLLCRFLALNWS